MAAGYLRKLLQERGILHVDVRPAGVLTVPGLLASQEAISIMGSEGIDIGKHRSSPLTPDMIRRADLILGMTPLHIQEAVKLSKDARGKSYLLKEYVNCDPKNAQIPDPMGSTLEIFKKCFKEIREACAMFADTDFVGLRRTRYPLDLEAGRVVRPNRRFESDPEYVALFAHASMDDEDDDLEIVEPVKPKAKVAVPVAKQAVKSTFGQPFGSKVVMASARGAAAGGGGVALAVPVKSAGRLEAPGHVATVKPAAASSVKLAQKESIVKASSGSTKPVVKSSAVSKPVAKPGSSAKSGAKSTAVSRPKVGKAPAAKTTAKSAPGGKTALRKGASAKAASSAKSAKQATKSAVKPSAKTTKGKLFVPARSGRTTGHKSSALKPAAKAVKSASKAASKPPAKVKASSKGVKARIESAVRGSGVKPRASASAGKALGTRGSAAKTKPVIRNAKAVRAAKPQSKPVARKPAPARATGRAAAPPARSKAKPAPARATKVLPPVKPSRSGGAKGSAGPMPARKAMLRGALGAGRKGK